MYTYSPFSDTDLNSLDQKKFVIARVWGDANKQKRAALVGKGYTGTDTNVNTDNHLDATDFVAVNARLESGKEQQTIVEFDDATIANDSIWKFERANDSTDSTGSYYVELLDANLNSRKPAQYLNVNTSDSGGNEGKLSVAEERKPVYVTTDNNGHYYLGTNQKDITNVYVSMNNETTKDGFHAYNVQNEPTRKLLTLFQINEKITAPGLSTIDTLDTASTGITTTMYDYVGKCDNGENPEGSWGQHNSVEQNLYIKNENDNESNHYYQNIVQVKLGDNGLPVISPTFRPDNTKGSTEGLFGNNGNNVITTENSLFSKKIYDDTGWFEYDSNNNYAYLDQQNKQFEVYNQIGTPIYQSAFKYTQPQAYQRGNFMPYNRIAAGKYSDFTNDLDSANKPLEPGSAREHEVLYKTQKTSVQNGLNSTDSVEGNDYYFGMKMVVPSFYQPKDGKVYKKVNGIEQKDTEDMEYTFCGDDDLWVFIDDVLVLDIGGIHGAINGSINFASGAVKVGPGDNEKAHPLPTKPTSIYQRFVEAGYTAEQLNDIFVDSTYDGKPTKIFKNFSTHSLKMFYMERGAGASDLNMRFNLQLPTKVTVKNTMVPNPDYETYKKKDYKFQLMKKNPDGSFSAVKKDDIKAVYVDDNGKELEPVEFDEDGTFKLNLEQSAKFVLPDISDEYYVQEVGVDPDLIRKVSLKVNDNADTDLKGNNGTFSGDPRKVENREKGDNLVFTNYPVYRVKVTKEDGNDSSKKLSGAVFNLGIQNGKVISGNMKTSDEKGVATENKERNSDAIRLSDGTYTLNETTAPDGYDLMSGNLTLTIQDASEKKNAVKVSHGSVQYDGLSYETDKDGFTVYNITVKNYKKSEKPESPEPGSPSDNHSSNDQPGVTPNNNSGVPPVTHSEAPGIPADNGETVPQASATPAVPTETPVSSKKTTKGKPSSAKTTEKKSNVPDTGDHTGIMRWTGLLIGAIAVIACVSGFRKKHE